MTHPPAPIFLFASERSGTNLLRMRLNGWQSTAFSPQPAHFLKHLYELEPYYGHMCNNENFRKLVNDALDLCYIHFSPWNHCFNAKDILKVYHNTYGERRNTILLADIIMTEYAKAKGYPTYFCKDNHLFNFAFQLLFYLPGARFIYLHRDPRDYVLSQQKRGLMTSNPYAIALLWRNEQIRCIRTYTEPSFKDNMIKISYEKLIQEETQTLNKICEFCNLKLNKEKIFTKLQEKIPDDWKNINKPTLTKNYNKFKTEMSLKQIKRVESIVWNQMVFLGYEPISKIRPKRNSIDMAIIYIQFFLLDRFNKIRFAQHNKFKYHHLRYKFLTKLKNRMH